MKEGFIIKGRSSFEIISSGSWLEFIEFDGEIFWKIDEDVEPWETDAFGLLPSHSLFRLDYRKLKENDIKNADEY